MQTAWGTRTGADEDDANRMIRVGPKDPESQEFQLKDLGPYVPLLSSLELDTIDRKSLPTFAPTTSSPAPQLYVATTHGIDPAFSRGDEH